MAKGTSICISWRGTSKPRGREGGFCEGSMAESLRKAETTRHETQLVEAGGHALKPAPYLIRKRTGTTVGCFENL